MLGSAAEAESATGGSRMGGMGATFAFLHQHPEYGLSNYDFHKDGSGVAYSSALRPQLMMRPGEGLWQFPAVSRHDIAAIWVEFFSRCQRYRCLTGLAHRLLHASGWRRSRYNHR